VRDFNSTRWLPIKPFRGLEQQSPPTSSLGSFCYFFKAGGFAGSINRTLLVAHELSVTLKLFCEPQFPFIVLCDLSIQQRNHSTTLSGIALDQRVS
jgi:hypothetical protein